jgi:MSHA pilin protein MshD
MRRQTGATLVELIISVVIIATLSTSAMMLIAQTTGRSADPVIRIQAIAIAEAYMEEILSQAFPGPGDVGPEAGETRAVFDDIADYNGLADSDGAYDQNANPVSGLEAYNIAVSVADSTLNGAPAKRIRVAVSHDADPVAVYPLVAYRLN